MDQAELPDYYEVLQVSRNAQSIIVTKAYRLLAAFYHPDNNESGDPEAFKRVVDAYRALSDPVRRAAYDRERFGPAGPTASSKAEVVGDGFPERRVEDERELRCQILLALYHARRTQPHHPSLPLMVIPDLFGCSVDEAQFTLWYLRGKRFIEMTDEGMVITVHGVDNVEGNDFIVERPVPETPSLVGRPFMLAEGN